jgi:MFS family permease
MKTIFYGWWLVAAYLVIAAVGWSLGTFGMGVYIHILSLHRGFTIGLISSAVTVSFLVNAVTLMFIGNATVHYGPRPVIASGGTIIGLAVACIPWCQEVWHVFLLMAFMGIGRSCLSTATISTALAPWFERYQGRAISMALLGASVGGIVGTPLLLGGVSIFGFQIAFLLAGLSSMILLIPISIFVLRNKPQDMGLYPDGIKPSANKSPVVSNWTRAGAMKTRRFQTQLVAFGLGLMVQVGFLSHHVSMTAPALGEKGASLAVSAAAISAFIGRVLLARYSDHVDVRLTTSLVLTVAAVSLACMAIFNGPTGLIISSIAYGLTIGNLTTLSPIIVRREFGAESFGAVFGIAASLIAFAMAFGPGLFGVIRDAYGSYGPALLLAGGLNLVAAVIIVWGRDQPLPAPS